MESNYLDPIVFDADQNNIFEVECGWNLFEDFIFRHRKLCSRKQIVLKNFYYDRFFKLVKQFPRNYCTTAYVNAIHYCICSGRQFYKSLSRFKFAICEQSESRLSDIMVDKIEKIFSF